jgi:hypothetical protein
MGHRPFGMPLFLKLDSVANYCATSPWEALEYLDLHWPGARTARFERARSVCQLAIDGWVDAEVARDAVIAAAREAGLLQRLWRPEAIGTPQRPAHA